MIVDESECIQDDDNFTEAYWKREEIEGYKKTVTNQKETNCSTWETKTQQIM